MTLACLCVSKGGGGGGVRGGMEGGILRPHYANSPEETALRNVKTFPHLASATTELLIRSIRAHGY